MSIGSKIKNIEDKGFYIILFLCIMAIGIASYVLFFTGNEDKTAGPEEVNTPAESLYEWETAIPQQDASDQPDADDVNQMPEDENVISVMNPKLSDEDTAPSEEEPMVPEPEVLFVRPVPGETTKPFSNQELLYDQTMGDWRTHNGTDFAANVGDRIYAISDGTIRRVFVKDLQGQCVELELTDGKTILYTGLSDRVLVDEGASVKAGDVIGSLGEPIESEVLQGPHFHLEYKDGDTYANVEDLIPPAES